MTSQLFKSFPVADAAEGLHSHLQGALAQHKETTKGTPFTSCVLQSIQIMALCVCVCVKDKHPKHHSFINQRVTFVPFILGTQTSSAAHRRVTCDLALQICELSFLRAIHLPVCSIVTIQHSLLFQVIIIIARLVGGGEGKNSSACFKAVPLEQNEEVVH